MEKRNKRFTIAPFLGTELEELARDILLDPEKTARRLQQMVKDLQKPLECPVDPLLIIDLICTKYGVTAHQLSDMGEYGNKYKIRLPRQLTAFLLAQFTSLHRTEVMAYCGYKHDGSLGHALYSMTNEIRKEPATREAYGELVEQINQLKAQESTSNG